MRNNRRQLSSVSSGFTIIELMIATAVLSVVLLLSTILITAIGNLYYKGVNQSRTQDNLRSITDDVTQNLELTDGNLTLGSISRGGYTIKAYCIGSVRYSYVIGVKIGTGSGTINHVLWRDNNSSGGCIPLDLTQSTPTAVGSINGVEMIAPNSRLTSFDITPSSSPYSVSISTAFGDSDLLIGNGINTTCKGGAGQQFCATASLSTTAVRRVN